MLQSTNELKRNLSVGVSVNVGILFSAGCGLQPMKKIIRMKRAKARDTGEYVLICFIGKSFVKEIY
jgi:hypothetical protein